MMRRLFSCIFLMVPMVYADVKMPALLSNNMVLQQNSNAMIWGWAEPGEKVAVKADWPDAATKTTAADDQGNWQIQIATPTAGGPFSISIEGNNSITISNILSGELWICSGQSNMSMPLSGFVRNKQFVNDSEQDIANAENNKIRLFTVANKFSDIAEKDVQGRWLECKPETVKNFSAVGYHFAKETQTGIKQPVGMILSAWGGTQAEAWTRRELIVNDDELSHVAETYDRELLEWNAAVQAAEEQGTPQPKRNFYSWPQQKPGALYNGMIAPLTKMTIKGVIWYQGESNRERSREYRKLFPALIQNWRCDFGDADLPFYFVQLAAYGNPYHVGIREAQLMTTRLRNTGMAVAIDIGAMNCIHPAEKKSVGQRLAYWALAKDYGKQIAFSGPLYMGYQIEDQQIRVLFNYASSGLLTDDDKITGFIIAGEDRKFVAAEAVIEGNTVVVSSDTVKQPVAVRYGWDPAFTGCLVNEAKLPASPFRTDDWQEQSSTPR